MTDLTTHSENSTNAKLPMPMISRGLGALLNVEPQNSRAVSEIVSTPALLDEARRLLPDLQRYATQPAGPEGVYRVLASRRVIFPQPVRTPEESDAWYGAYYDVCADLPETALEVGMQAWVAKPDSQFMPKPGELRALALATPSRLVRAVDRCRAAVEYEAPKPPIESPYDFGSTMRRPPPLPTAADREHVRRQMRDFLAKDDDRRAKADHKRRNDGPSIAGPADEKGVTPAMRALLAKRDQGTAA
ncbi:MAG: hypothetical protein J7521_20290 [Caulobacter sp.]|nr:hypothetical protein [Caulobacter sp.]